MVVTASAVVVVVMVVKLTIARSMVKAYRKPLFSLMMCFFFGLFGVFFEYVFIAQMQRENVEHIYPIA